MDKTDLITASQAAELLGVTRQAVAGRIKRGSLVAVDEKWQGAMRQPLYRRSDVEALRPKADPSEAISGAAA